MRGNVFAAGSEVEILGTIEGALHAVGRRVTIEGKVHQSVFGAAETFTLHERGDVGRDAVLFGESVHIDGRLGRDLFSAAERVEIRGTVSRDASTRANRLALHDGASIIGNLHYELGKGDAPDIAPGARIGGETTSGELMYEAGPENRWLEGDFYMGVAVFLVSVFLAGMLLHLLLPDLFFADLERSSDFFRALGYGAIALIGTPIAKCDSLSAASRAAAHRLGFSFEGVFRQATVYKGRNRDTAWYSIIDSEWKNLREAFRSWLDPNNFDDEGKQRMRLSDLTCAEQHGSTCSVRPGSASARRS